MNICLCMMINDAQSSIISFSVIAMIGFYYNVDIIGQTANDPDCEGYGTHVGSNVWKTSARLQRSICMMMCSFSVLIKVILGSTMMGIYFSISLQPLSQYMNPILGTHGHGISHSKANIFIGISTKHNICSLQLSTSHVCDRNDGIQIYPYTQDTLKRIFIASCFSDMCICFVNSMQRHHPVTYWKLLCSWRVLWFALEWYGNIKQIYSIEHRRR